MTCIASIFQSISIDFCLFLCIILYSRNADRYCVLYCTVYSVYRQNDYYKQYSVCIHYIFDDNTSQSYSPYRTLKSFLLYSLTRCILDQYYAFFSALCKSIDNSKRICDSNTTYHIALKSVLEAVPTVQSSRPRPPSELRV